MDMKMEWQSGILIAWLDGDLNTANSATIETEFREMVEKRPKGVLLNFAKAHFASSLGIGLIMGLNRDLKGIGAKLRITGVPAAVRLVLDTCNLSHIIPIDQTMEYAMKMLTAEKAAIAAV